MTRVHCGLWLLLVMLLCITDIDHEFPHRNHFLFFPSLSHDMLSPAERDKGTFSCAGPDELIAIYGVRASEFPGPSWSHHLEVAKPDAFNDVHQLLLFPKSPWPPRYHAIYIPSMAAPGKHNAFRLPGSEKKAAFLGGAPYQGTLVGTRRNNFTSRGST